MNNKKKPQNTANIKKPCKNQNFTKGEGINGEAIFLKQA